ncbi:MAG: glycoside hydrolase family 3 C-terminal domain-containing protein, partial [Bifidobacteriaceae bacterium]|nr:glycoside hydrolase family 3 C-terminal domain-containing protein [Bifidobacteriaceae bacterium]
ALITATVTADGTTKSTSFPVIVYDGAHATTYQGTTTTLFASQVDIADVSVTRAQAANGVRLSAALVPASASATYEYRIAPMDTNTAGATLTPEGVLTASEPGQVRVTVVASEGATQIDTRSALVTITGPRSVDTTALEARLNAIQSAIADGTLAQASYTPESWAALRTALLAGRAALIAASTQVAVDEALAALVAAYDGLVGITPPYMDTSVSFAERAADLVSRMTLAEKAQQFRAAVQSSGSQAPAIARLGVGRYNYWNEALHGVARSGTIGQDTYGGVAANNPGTATELPTGLGLASTWNPGLVQGAMSMVGDEARAYANLSGKGLTYWSPTINMHRDPRWGRAEETYGEDPYLTSTIGGGFVTGMEGTDPKYTKAITTPKHFLANNSENNRHVGSSNLTEAELREYYTPAFAALAGTQYGAGSLMTAYNSINGVPAPANRYTVETLLRRTWGFDGFITSDCGAIEDIADTGTSGHAWAPEILGRAVTRAEATAWAIKAGTDVDCTGSQYSGQTVNAVRAGSLTEDDVDIALIRAFTARMELGEFDPADQVPWKGPEYTIANQIGNPEHLAAAQQLSDEAPVLLKNEAPAGSTAKALPLGVADAKNVVVVGYMADEVEHGDYSPTNTVDKTNAVQGITKAAEGLIGDAANVTFIPGITAQNAARPLIGSVRFYNASDEMLSEVFPAAFSERAGWTNQNTSGQYPVNIQTANNATSGYFALKNLAVPAGTVRIDVGSGGLPANILPGGSLVVRTGGLASANPVVANVPVGAADPAQIAQNAQGRVPTYRSGTLATGLAGTTVDLYFSYQAGDPVLTQAEQDAIRDAEAVIAYVGTRRGDSAEESDRNGLDLPRGQAQLVKAVAGLNAKTVVYIQAVSQVSVELFKDDVPAIVWSTYNG